MRFGRGVAWRGVAWRCDAIDTMRCDAMQYDTSRCGLGLAQQAVADGSQLSQPQLFVLRRRGARDAVEEEEDVFGDVAHVDSPVVGDDVVVALAVFIADEPDRCAPAVDPVVLMLFGAVRCDVMRCDDPTRCDAMQPARYCAQ